ncbi:Cell wall integrity and stress response component 4, partial [Colletotrichum sp. SAR 10_65]
MAFTDRFTRCWAIFALVILSWAALAHATPDPRMLDSRMLEPRQLKQTLCSSSNTASMSANLSIWQTNGLCSDFCRGKNFAFAIVQYQSCWCSDVAPAASSEADVEDKCNDICPGYDTEKCGSRPN